MADELVVPTAERSAAQKERKMVVWMVGNLAGQWDVSKVAQRVSLSAVQTAARKAAHSAAASVVPMVGWMVVVLAAHWAGLMAAR